MSGWLGSVWKRGRDGDNCGENWVVFLLTAVAGPSDPFWVDGDGGGRFRDVMCGRSDWLVLQPGIEEQVLLEGFMGGRGSVSEAGAPGSVGGGGVMVTVVGRVGLIGKKMVVVVGY